MTETIRIGIESVHDTRTVVHVSEGTLSPRKATHVDSSPQLSHISYELSPKLAVISSFQMRESRHKVCSLSCLRPFELTWRLTEGYAGQTARACFHSHTSP
jgi:hypothetical protein